MSEQNVAPKILEQMAAAYEKSLYDFIEVRDELRSLKNRIGLSSIPNPNEEMKREERKEKLAPLDYMSWIHGRYSDILAELNHLVEEFKQLA